MAGPNQATRTLVYERAGFCCEVCGVYAYAGSLHHRRRRGMGGTRRPEINAPANLILLCGSGTTGCHGHVESHRVDAYTAGLLLHASDDPSTTPVQLRYGLVLLDNNGLIEYTEGDPHRV